MGRCFRRYVLGSEFYDKTILTPSSNLPFFSSWKNKNFYTIGGVVFSGCLGFLGSLLIVGSSIENYYIFLTEVPKTLVGDLFQEVWKHNISPLRYIPNDFKLIVSITTILLLSGIACFVSKKPGSNVLPWFFITLLPLPLIWDFYMLGAPLPSIIFLFFTTKEGERVIACAMAVCLVYFSSIFTVPIIVYAILICLWLWQILPLFFRKE